MTSNHKPVLAIHGGKPVRTTPMPFRGAFGENEIAMLHQAIDYYHSRQQDPPYQGHFESLFCQEFVNFMGGGYADAVASGTAAVFIALAALDLPPKSEVIISPVTDSGPLNSIIMQGLIPVVADSKPHSYNIGVEQFLERITPRTSALLAVHAAGEPLEIDRMVTLAHEKGIKVLEDVSQAPGATWNSLKAGTVGDMAAFSTMYRKNLTAGASSGIVYSRDIDLFHRALAHADRGKPSWRTDINLNDPGHALFPALNFNTDEFSCAIGLASLRRIPQTISNRVEFINKLNLALNENSRSCRPYGFHNGFSPFYYPILVDTEKISCSKIDFANAIAAEGIGLLPHYGCLVSSWPWAKPYLAGNTHTPNANYTRDHSFNLYVNENYGEQEVEDIITAISKIEQVY